MLREILFGTWSMPLVQVDTVLNFTIINFVLIKTMFSYVNKLQ